MASRHNPRCATLIPNSTCPLPSLLAPANDGEPDASRPQTANAAARTFMGTEATITLRTRRSKACATSELEIRGCFCTQMRGDLRNPEQLCSYTGDLRSGAGRHAAARPLFRVVAAREVRS